MTLPNILQLREPPVVGRFYMVPSIFGKYASREDWWPVLLPAHTDGDFFPTFPWHHYHIDYRFLAARKLSYLAGRTYSARQYTSGYPIVVTGPKLPETRPWHDQVKSDQKPTLRQLKCTSANPGFPYRDSVEIKRLCKSFMEGVGGARCIRTKSGRALCPHQRVDLSSYPVDTDGTVICPAHGLKVQVVA